MFSAPPRSLFFALNSFVPTHSRHWFHAFPQGRLVFPAVPARCRSAGLASSDLVSTFLFGEANTPSFWPSPIPPRRIARISQRKQVGFFSRFSLYPAFAPTWTLELPQRGPLPDRHQGLFPRGPFGPIIAICHSCLFMFC